MLVAAACPLVPWMTVFMEPSWEHLSTNSDRDEAAMCARRPGVQEPRRAWGVFTETTRSQSPVPVAGEPCGGGRSAVDVLMPRWPCGRACDNLFSP